MEDTGKTHLCIPPHNTPDAETSKDADGGPNQDQILKDGSVFLSRRVMDVFNQWNDDPEEVLLDLGFSCDESDLSGRIPSRFINHQSQARGINLKVFLEAQKNRLNLENPDVSSRFRQLEVLQHVTTAFSSFVGSPSSSSSSLKAPSENLSPETRERRKRMGVLLRRAAKKSLTKPPNSQDLTPPTANCSPNAANELLRLPDAGGKSVSLKRVKAGHQETARLSPLVEEQGSSPEPSPQLEMTSVMVQEETLGSGTLRDGSPAKAKKILGQTKDSFEMEEIHSVDENSVAGNIPGGLEHLVRVVTRTNSSQSDSSGFLEEPFIPSPPQQLTSGADSIQTPTGLSQGYTRQCSPPYATLLCISDTVNEQPLLSSPYPPLEPPLVSPSMPCGTSSHLNLDPGGQRPMTEMLQDEERTLCPFTALVFDSPLPQSSKINPSNEDKEDFFPSPCPCTPPQSSEGIACPAYLSISQPNTSQCSSINLGHQSPDLFFGHSPQSHIPSEFSAQNETTQIELALHEKPMRQSTSSPMLLHPCPDFHLSQHQSHSCFCEVSQFGGIFADADRIDLSDPPLNKQKGEENLLLSTLFLNPSDSCEGQPETLECYLSPHIPVCHFMQQSPTDQTDERMSDTINQSVPKQERPCISDDNVSPAVASHVQDVIQVEMDEMPLDTNQTEMGAEANKTHSTDTVQIYKCSVYISDTESSEGLSGGSGLVSGEVYHEKETGDLVPCCTPHIELWPEIKNVSTEEIVDTESEKSKNSFHELPESQVINSGTMAEEPNLIPIDSLDLAFETSVDGSQSDFGDLDAFLHQLDAEEQVYWAEPIVLSATSPVFGETESYEDSEGCSCKTLLPGKPDSPDSKSTPERTISSAGLSTTQLNPLDDCPAFAQPSFSTMSADSHFKSPSCSVSIQMPSSPSSHIVHRKEVPCMTDSICAVLPVDLPLEISTPPSWTDMEIQQTMKKSSHEALHTFQNEETASSTVSEKTQRAARVSPASASCPRLAQSHDLLGRQSHGFGKNDTPILAVVDSKRWPDEDEEVDMRSRENAEKCKGNQASCGGSVEYCNSCNCYHSYAQRSYTEKHKLNISDSLDKLEEMMVCMQHFHSVLHSMEEQLSEHQAAAYNALSDQDRQAIEDIADLRRAVKHEAGELEIQLNELASDYSESLKKISFPHCGHFCYETSITTSSSSPLLCISKKLQRLLDEQSLLCSQLSIFPFRSTLNRTVATQCCLQSPLSTADV